MHAQFQGDVVKLMNIEDVLDQEVKTLSCSELQRVVIVLACERLSHQRALFVRVVLEHLGRFEQELSEFQFLGLGAAHNCGKGHQAFHPAREEDGFCHRARFHNGDLPRRPRHCLRGHSRYLCCPRLIYSKVLIALVLLQTTIATHGDEQIPAIVGNNVPSRPDQFPPTCEQAQFGQGQRAERSVSKLMFCERHLTAFCSASGNYFFLEE